jgi:ankyrin repeat protein
MVLLRKLSRRDSLKCNTDRDDRGWTPLHVAARMGNLDEVQRLIDAGANVNEPSTGPKSPGATPLHLAATGGHIDVMDELLERGADIEVRTKGGCGWTPLHNAAKERNRKAVRFLLENGAFLPPEMTDGRFNPPLHYCPGLHWAYKVRNKLQAEAQQIKKSEDEESTSDT